MVVKQSGGEAMYILVGLISDVKEVGLAFIIPSSIGDITFPTFFYDGLSEHLCDFAVRAPVSSNVDL